MSEVRREGHQHWLEQRRGSWMPTLIVSQSTSILRDGVKPSGSSRVG
jgi:hypothetical protein